MGAETSIYFGISLTIMIVVRYIHKSFVGSNSNSFLLFLANGSSILITQFSANIPCVLSTCYILSFYHRIENKTDKQKNSDFLISSWPDFSQLLSALGPPVFSSLQGPPETLAC